jgi:hypothetical protein
VLFVISILPADVFWENGSPLYEGNYIYHSHSVKTENNEIYICWTETDQGLRKLKLQKTDYLGNPIWAEPLTIDESSEFMIDLDLMNSTNYDLFMPVYSYASDSNLLYKLDEYGSVLWNNEFDYNYWNNPIALTNGGILNLRIDTDNSTDYLHGLYFDTQGTIIWDDLNLLELPVQNCNNEIISKVFIVDQLSVLMRMGQELFFMKFDDNGYLLYQSEPFDILNFGIGKFMNDNFYVLFNDEDVNELKMWQFDLNGNSISGTTPITITILGDYFYDYLLTGDNYFNCLSLECNDVIKLLKCDYQGNLLAENLIETTDFHDMSVYDQDQDFICISGYGPNGYESYLVKIDVYGAGDPIFYLPEEFYNNYFWPNEKYYINDGFTMIGNIRYGHEFITTLRKTDVPSTLQEVREINNEIISPILIKQDDGLHAYWRSYVQNNIMTQVFNDFGDPQLEINGAVLIENEKNFYYSDDIFYCFEISNYKDTADTVSIRAYDLAGNPLWANSAEFVIMEGYHNHIGITPFYNGLLFHIATDQGNWIDSEMEAMYFDETGFLWSETVTLDFGVITTYASYDFKNNYLFHVYNNNVFGVKINENGSCEGQFLLAFNSDFHGTYGTDDDFLVITHIDDTTENALHYFHDGEPIWDNPLYVSVNRYYDLQPFFADDHFYLTGFNPADSVEVHQFDLEQNFIAENSFGFPLVNPHPHGIITYHKSDNFIFFIHGSDAQYDHEFTYTIYDESGNQLVAEFEEILMDRPNNEHIEDIEFIGNNAYLDLTTGIKVMEGGYERNHYIQKIDLSEYVDVSEYEINQPDTPYLIQAYPNPFNPTTTIQFSIPQASKVDLIVFNIKGQTVKQLVDDKLDEGHHSIIWNGNNESGKKVSSGVYLYKLNVNGKNESMKKCLLLK